MVDPAEDITNSKKDITSINVISVEGAYFDQDYYIEFQIDPPPISTLVSDSVEADSV